MHWRPCKLAAAAPLTTALSRSTVGSMDWEGEGLGVLEASLRLAESELRKREERALAGGLTGEAQRAIAAEHDRIASARDVVADLQDERAAARDLAGLQRDVSGSSRDRRARDSEDDCDPGFPDRFLSAEDRDDAAGDRAESHDDRARAHQAREHAAADRNRAADEREQVARLAVIQTPSLAGLSAALEARRLIGQAQGLLMARHSLSTDDAFASLVRLSRVENVNVGDIAARLISSSEPAQPVGVESPGPEHVL